MPPDPPDPSPLAWTSTPAAKSLALSATITPEMRCALEATVDAARPPLPFDGLRSSRLPAVDVHIDVRAAGADGETGDLVVRELLGEGGMGAVYLAEQRSLARAVAIKTTRDREDGAQLRALLWEAASAGHLDHPGVTPVHLVGRSADGHPVLVMKRIVGHPWSELVSGGDEVWALFPMLSRDRVRAHVEILMEVARTIHYAHRRGVVHLDLKPDNVMIGELGEVYVVDWGVATMDAAGTRAGFVGTPTFAAPEMVTGEPIGPFTDVYLLGATLHTVLTGTPRHAGTTLVEVLRAAAQSAPIDYGDDVPVELADLANAATSRDVARRPKDALAFRAALSTFLEHAASIELAREGAARLAELGDRGRDPAQRLRLATEARFALRAALDRWPGNREASTALGTCLEHAVRLELERENVVAAREAARELETVAAVPEELARALDALERELRERARSADELRKLKDESDLARGGRERVVLGVAILASALLAFVGLSAVSGAMTMSALYMLSPPLGGVAVLAALVWWLRRGLLANRVGRRIVLLLFATELYLAMHRAAAIFFPLAPDGIETRSEMFLVSVVGFGLAVFVTPRAWPVVGIPLVGVLAVSSGRLGDASNVFNVVGLLTLVAFVLAFRRPAPSPEGADAG